MLEHLPPTMSKQDLRILVSVNKIYAAGEVNGEKLPIIASLMEEPRPSIKVPNVKE